MDKVKAYLTETGIEVKDENLKLLKIADSDKARLVFRQVSYYDENEDKSIVFTDKGEPNYKISYQYDKLGAIKDYDISDIYLGDDNEWVKDISKIKAYVFLLFNFTISFPLKD